ncbi:MAG: 16S rRNA (cytosine(1402)-N(4))-methyltransferase RsmH [Treponema sp.]|jgi:16S rRNA (cytosine1402-N4)-methyltransferase|nr:16S rRNA (cytosine(1402)-N(4))-methyltransferase RsmH [Treponema sp.]
MEIVHTPVLLEETIQYLAPGNGAGLMVDATMGEGGHSHAFLSRFPDLKIIGIDADRILQAVAMRRLEEFGGRVHFYSGWAQAFFAGYPAELKRPDTILADLGVSLYHYEKSGRGFSFQKDEALDMRLDVSSGNSAAELLARLPEKELADLLYNNSGERYSRRIAKLIVQERQRGTITTTAALASLVERAAPASYRHGPIHPATRTFQALRIAVNGELSRLPDLLEGALRVLEPGGRLGIITFHSLEDRIVKNFFRMKNKDCTCPPEAPICRCEGRRSVNILTRKGIVPAGEEIARNPPSRSARLRVVEKILDEDGQ